MAVCIVAHPFAAVGFLVNILADGFCTALVGVQPVPGVGIGVINFLAAAGGTLFHAVLVPVILAVHGFPTGVGGSAVGGFRRGGLFRQSGQCNSNTAVRTAAQRKRNCMGYSSCMYFFYKCVDRNVLIGIFQLSFAGFGDALITPRLKSLDSGAQYFQQRGDHPSCSGTAKVHDAAQRHGIQHPMVVFSSITNGRRRGVLNRTLSVAWISRLEWPSKILYSPGAAYQLPSVSS